MSDHAGFVDGTTSVNFVADLATFSNLDFSASSASDKLVATLPLNSTQNLTATSNSFSVASPVVSRFTVTTTVNPIYGNVSYTITVTAVYPGGTTATGYNGTVSFTSSDSGFVNPGHLTLTNGVGHAIVTLATFGTQTITATDTVTSALTGSGSFMVVFPTAGLRITVPASAVVGTPFNFTVTAVDTQGHQATAYTGTVTLTSSDSYATLPSPATLTNGIGTFSATLATPGTQTITATDAVNRFAVTSSSIAVTAPNLVVNTAADGPGATQVCTAQAAPGSNTTDSGCSLRDALATATSLGGGAVSFDSTVFARSKGTAADTILLIEGPLYIPTNTSVTGPGGTMAQIVTVSGNAQSTVFVISNGVANTSISGLTITNGNFAPATGGDIDNDGELTVTNSVVSGATANAGGGIYNTGTLVLTGVTISGNTAFYGGGIYNSGSLTVTQSTILNNTTGTGGSGGGGISSYGGTVTLISSTVSGNYAGGDGGGIANYGTLTLINSTLYGNSTGASIAGAFTVSGSTTTENSTIANNAGIGLDIFDSSMTMSNTIISGNTGDFQNQGATVTDKGGNLIGGVTLTPLGNYGGPTQTAVPLPGSTAICGGTRANATAASLTTDQRGFGFISTYCPTGFVDAGAVQTNYSMAFTTEPPASGFPDVKLTRAPAVQLKESGFIATAATNPLSMSGSPVTLSRTTSANLSGGSATFSNLAVSAVTSSETLTATLALTSSVKLTAASTPNTIDVGKLTPTVSLNAISSPLTLGPSTSLTAVFTTVSGAPAPTQQMKFYAGSTLLGSATLTTSSSTTYRATLSSAEIPLGSETIVATYPGDSSYVTASSSGQTINVVSKILWIGNPAGTTSAFVDNGTPYLSSAESHGGKGIAIDSSGNVWSLNATGNSVAEFTSSGTVTSAGHTGGGLSAPTSLAIDGSGNVWITNSGGSISVFKSAGTAVSATAYTGGELNSPTSIAVDISGNLWIANHGSKSVTKVLGAAAPTVPLAKGVVNGTAATKP
jgi:hypothetical protein